MSIEQFLTQIKLFSGFVPPADGNIYRWASPNHPDQKDCWGWFKEIRPGVFYGKCADWHDAEKVYTYSSEDKLSAVDQKHVERAVIQFERQKQAKQQIAKKRAKQIWAASVETGIDQHPYVLSKKIIPYGARISGVSLVLPIVDTETKELVSLQFISPDGEKRFLEFGQTQNCGIVIDGEDDISYVCEGYADGASIHESTKKRVIAALTASNLKNIVRKLGHESKIVIAADFDLAGLDGANATKYPIALPKTYKDFNDLFIAEGCVGVQDALANKSGTASLKQFLEKQKPISAAEIAMTLFSFYEFAVCKKALYVWKDSRWSPVFPDRSFFQLYCSIEPDGWFTRKRATDAYYKVLSSVTKEMTLNSIPKTLIPFKNGVLSLDTFEITPHKKEYFIDKYVPHVFEIKEPKKWEALLASMLLNEEQKSFLQEFFGYCLLPHARFRQALWFYGVKRGGKSTLLNFLSKAVGRENTCALNPSKLDDAKELAPLVGKMVNIMDEIKSTALGEGSGFKRIVSSGLVVQINEKYIPQYMYEPTCCHIFASNDLPIIKDTSDASYDRLTFIEIKKTFSSEEQNPHLIDEIDINEVLTWAVIGAKRITDSNGRFTVVKSSVEIIKEIEYDENFVERFLEAEVVRERGSFIDMKTIRNLFRNFTGLYLPDNTIGRMFKRAGCSIQPRTIGNKTIRCLIGYDVV
jgi:P4 family phage/plasmid primase-like protien